MAQKILVIDGHPESDRARFCHALADAYLKGAMEAGKETRLITLAETPVDFLRSARDFSAPPRAAEIKSAQADILWADHVVIVFPLWLGGAPALVHAFLEQVACGGFFAETAGPGIRPKFKGKSARLIVTMGMPAFVYRLVFRAHGVRNIISGVLGFAGFGPVRATMLGAVESIAPDQQKLRLDRAHMLGRDGR
jgi:putative NADPH-quinone reductase